jgi:hypothetical protein
MLLCLMMLRCRLLFPYAVTFGWNRALALEVKRSLYGHLFCICWSAYTRSCNEIYTREWAPPGSQYATSPMFHCRKALGST